MHATIPQPPRPRPLRPQATLWLLSILLALPLQFPIAWSCARLGRNTTPAWDFTLLLRPSSIDSDTETIQIGSISHMGVRAVSIEAYPISTLSRRALEVMSVPPDSPKVRNACAPWLPADLHPALADSSAWPPRTGVYSRPNLIHTESLDFRVASGWPLPCIEGRITYGPSRPIQYTGIITDPRFLPAPTNETAYLCYLPRWPALLLNALIDGTILTLLILAASSVYHSLRARIRRRRNLCSNCAYDLRATPSGTPCPECGHHPTSARNQ